MNGAEPTTAGTHAQGSHDTNDRQVAWHVSALSIITFLGILGIIQILFVRSHLIQEILYLGYFIPITIAATRLSRRSAVEVSVISAVVYLVAYAPNFVISFQEASEVAITAIGHTALFLAAGLGLSAYRHHIDGEREKSRRTEREQRRKLRLMHDVSSTLSTSLNLEHVLQIFARRIAEVTKATVCRISLLDETGENLKIMAIYPVREIDRELSLGRTLPLDVMADYRRAIEKRQAVIIGDGRPGADGNAAGRQKQSFCEAASVILCPLVVGDEAVGVVCIGEQRKWEQGPESPERINTCQTVVNQGARAVGQALTHRELEQAFLGTVRSLAEAIDARDPSARGHSEWVSRYAVMIGRQLKLSKRELGELRYAGYLHDVGKIGIPDGIRSKSNRLSPDQWRLMKKHPTMGERILWRVKLSEAIKTAIRHHHERYDGKGYPDGCAGEEIPLAARILAVANVYEAMTSDRLHRKALSDEQAMAELIRCSGTQFDPVVVEAFLRAMGLLAPCASETASGIAAA